MNKSYKLNVYRDNRYKSESSVRNMKPIYINSFEVEEDEENEEHADKFKIAIADLVVSTLEEQVKDKWDCCDETRFITKNQGEYETIEDYIYYNSFLTYLKVRDDKYWEHIHIELVEETECKGADYTMDEIRDYVIRQLNK